MKLPYPALRLLREQLYFKMKMAQNRLRIEQLIEDDWSLTDDDFDMNKAEIAERIAERLKKWVVDCAPDASDVLSLSEEDVIYVFNLKPKKKEEHT